VGFLILSLQSMAFPSAILPVVHFRRAKNLRPGLSRLLFPRRLLQRQS
jgi:hypothetical protein